MICACGEHHVYPVRYRVGVDRRQSCYHFLAYNFAQRHLTHFYQSCLWKSQWAIRSWYFGCWAVWIRRSCRSHRSYCSPYGQSISGKSCEAVSFLFSIVNANVPAIPNGSGPMPRINRTEALPVSGTNNTTTSDDMKRCGLSGTATIIVIGVITVMVALWWRPSCRILLYYALFVMT